MEKEEEEGWGERMGKKDVEEAEAKTERVEQEISIRPRETLRRHTGKTHEVTHWDESNRREKGGN